VAEDVGAVEPVAATPVAEASVPAIGLALSGGGIRATLFSLGVVIALIDTGANQWVRCIASVSGGSLLNAWLAHASDFSLLKSPNGCQAGKFAKMLAHGVFAWSPGNLLKVVRSAIGLLPTLFGFGVTIAGFVAGMLEGERQPAVNMALQSLRQVYGLVPPLIWIYIVATLSVFAAFLLRGRWQEAIFGVKLGELTGNARCTLTSFATSRVQHVLVSTDLKSACPVFFSKDFVHCQTHGWSEPGSLRTATALYASAAFPIVFPPRRLWTSRFAFRNGKAGELRGLALADGGVYNNLGDDWFKTREEQLGEMWPYGGLKVDVESVREPVSTQIVVNAGAPSEPIPWLYPGLAILRTMSVLYDNTVKPRVDQIVGGRGLLLDIKDSPPDLAKNGTGFVAVKGTRAAQIGRQLARRDKTFWDQLKAETAKTPTKLSGVEDRTVAALMHHGYLSAMVLLWAEYGESLPRLEELRNANGLWPPGPDDPFPLKDEKYFLDLAKGKIEPAEGGDTK
jgi:predicted acylesterase/phospholipase RssA